MSLKDLLHEPDTSFAGRIERISNAIRKSTPEEEAAYINEVIELSNDPVLAPLAIGIIGTAGLREGFGVLKQRLESKGHTGAYYSQCLVALGQLGKADKRFLMGRTMPAALVALTLAQPGQSAEYWKAYSLKDGEACKALASIALQEHYRQRKLEGLGKRLDAIPPEILANISGELPKEIRDYVQSYTRRV